MQQKLDEDTREYLIHFYEILDDMADTMSEIPFSDSISCNIAAQLIPQQTAAVKMARNVLQYSDNPPVQETAIAVISGRKRLIGDLNRIFEKTDVPGDNTQDLCLYQRRYYHIIQVMLDDMGNSCETNDINGNYMRQMLPHLEGAVRMAQNALTFKLCPELRQVLDDLIVMNKRELIKLETLLKG